MRLIRRLDPLWKALAVLFVASAALLYHFSVRSFSMPSASMMPTFLVGDIHLCVGFMPGTLWAHSWPALNPDGYAPYVQRALKRGDLAIFKLPRDPSIDYVKRVVGLPGDRIRMVSGVLHINGVPIARSPMEPYADTGPYGQARRIRQFRETLPGGIEHRTLDLVPNGDLDNTAEYSVPPGHYFTLGDNRDNSVDSRVPPAQRGVGFVPAANFVCRPKLVFWSTSEPVGLRFWRLPAAFRFDRFLLRLQ